MKITDIHWKKLHFTFHEPIKVAFGVMTGYDTLAVKIITDEGIEGIGEAAPLGFVTGENIETVEIILKELREALLRENPIAIERIHEKMDSLYAGNTSAKAAIDIACYDLAAKKMGVPLYEYLGGSHSVVETDVTIGIQSPEKMAEDAIKWVDKGFRILKIKLGEDPKVDIKRMEKIRDAVGEDIILRIDANQGWSVIEAKEMAELLKSLNIEILEQPVSDWNFAGMKEVKDYSPIPVVADESCHNEHDALRLVSEHIVDGINIKLMKSGGIFNALKINAIAEAAGIPAMIGCMGESRIANGAAMHLAAAKRNIQKVDLDVTFFAEGEGVDGAFTAEGGLCTLSSRPGIGISVDNF